MKTQEEHDNQFAHPQLWEEYRQIAGLIDDLPAWNDAGPVDRSEWQRIIRLAAALQMLEADDVAQVLLVYMNSHPGLGLGQPTDHPYTKPLLLLRVMFDVPADSMIDSDAKRKEIHDQHIYVAGLFSWVGRNGQSPPEPSLSLPVAWDAESGPRLNAFRRTNVALIGGLGHYQPQREFQFFRERFPYRRDLERFLDERELYDRASGRIVRKKTATWHELHFQRRLDSNPEFRRRFLESFKGDEQT